MKKYESPILGATRVEMVDRTPWFYAVDICRTLAISRASVYVRRHANAIHIQKIQDKSHETLVVDVVGAKQLIEAREMNVERKTQIKAEIGRIFSFAMRTKNIEQAQIEQHEEAQEQEEKMQKTEQETGMKVFANPEFGEIRTEVVNGEPWFCLSDVCKALEIANSRNIKARLKEDGVHSMDIIDSMGRTQEATFVNEANLYKTIFQSRKESAERFTDWVTSEVLPSIRKTGGYQQEEQKPMSTFDQIKLLASGTMELAQRVTELATVSDKLETEVGNLKNDMPLYGCEIDEVQQHVRRKGVQCLGGKDSEAYHDASLRGFVYSDIYNQLKREYGCVSSYKSIKRKYIADVHEFIDCYQLPTALSEQVDVENAQQSLF